MTTNTNKHILKDAALACTLSTPIANITQTRAFFFFETTMDTLHTAPHWKTDPWYSEISISEYLNSKIRFDEIVPVYVMITGTLAEASGEAWLTLALAG